MVPMTTPKAAALRSFLLGGLLPIVIYTILEEKVGSGWALIFGMTFGALEILYEAIRYKKVQAITWIGNGLLIGMGGIALITHEGIWFRLQPALLEAGMGLVCWVSCGLKKPLLVVMSEKQMDFKTADPVLVGIIKKRFTGMTWRLGLFFLVHAALATYAAFYWSTSAWALLKGVGLTVSLIVVLGLEVYFLRRVLYGNRN